MRIAPDIEEFHRWWRGLPLPKGGQQVFQSDKTKDFLQESNDYDARREEIVRKGISAATYSPTQ